MHLLPIVDGTGASCGVAGSPLPAVPPVVVMFFPSVMSPATALV